MQLMSQCFNDAMFQCLNVPLVHWSIGPLVHWTIGPLVHWSQGPLVHWSIGPLDHWYIGPLDHWFIGSLVHWSIGPLVECWMLNVIKVKLLSKRTSGVPPVIFKFPLSAILNRVDLVPGSGYWTYLKSVEANYWYICCKSAPNGLNQVRYFIYSSWPSSLCISQFATWI